MMDFFSSDVFQAQKLQQTEHTGIGIMLGRIQDDAAVTLHKHGEAQTMEGTSYRVIRVLEQPDELCGR